MHITKVLFFTEAWGIGGIENFVINTAETLDQDRFSFDIFSTHDWSNAYDNKISRLHGHRYAVFKGEKPCFIKRIIASCRAWDRLLNRQQYDVVHINAMNGLGFIYSAIAKRHKVPIRLIHSHNSGFSSGSKTAKTIVHDISKTVFGNSATSRLACSQDAGSYLFGRKKFTIIHNGINTKNYRFNVAKRIELRQKFGISQDDLVFGAVGRLSEAKNPLFQVDILSDLCNRGMSAYLLLVGDGPLSEKIKVQAERKNVTDRLILPGPSTPESKLKVQDYLNMYDVFSMPSTFEGFPIAAIEAYANGLSLLLSNAVPTIGNAEDVEIHLPINNASQWSKVIRQMYFRTRIEDQLRKRSEKIYKAQILGYDREQVTEALEKIYRNQKSI